MNDFGAQQEKQKKKKRQGSHGPEFKIFAGTADKGIYIVSGSVEASGLFYRWFTSYLKVSLSLVITRSKYPSVCSPSSSK